MKKQGDLYLKIVSIVLAGIVVAYLVLSVLFGSGGSSYTLETAVRCEAGDGQTVSGFVVREEEIITASQPVVVCALTEGERVGSGQRVADGYQTSAAREKRDRLTALQEQLSQLRYAASGTAGEDTTQTDDAIEKALGELAALTARRDLTEADDVMSELQPLVLRRSVTADDAARMEGRIAELESQISALSAETEQSAEAVTVESAGYFSEQTDGLERVLTPGERAADEAERAACRCAACVCRSGQCCRQAHHGPEVVFCSRNPGGARGADCRGRDADRQLRTGKALPDQNAGRGHQRGGGRRLYHRAVLRARAAGGHGPAPPERGYHFLLLYRPARAEAGALYGRWAGGRLCARGRARRWKPVEILYAYGDGYVVELDQSSTGNLWPGDDIILTSDDIEDGKVMEA